MLGVNKLDSSSIIIDGVIDASVGGGGGQAPEDPDQDQKINTASSGRLILYKYLYINFSVRQNIKAINVHYAAYEDLGLPDLGSISPLFVV